MGGSPDVPHVEQMPTVRQRLCHPTLIRSNAANPVWLALSSRYRHQARILVLFPAAAARQVAAGALHCPDMALGRSGDWPTRRHVRTAANGGREAVVADMREAWNEIAKR